MGEGRSKYDLGAVMITQQPGSIPAEILSQGDNWFIFHLLSATDLTTLQKANAHFSQDLLSTLLNEPIPGQGVFWSSVGGKPYPVALRVLSFENIHQVQDAAYNRQMESTFAQKLREEYKKALEQATETNQTDDVNTGTNGESGEPVIPSLPGFETEPVDALKAYQDKAIDTLRNNSDIVAKINGDGIPWGALKGFLVENLPSTLEDRDNVAFQLVKKALVQIYGEKGWERSRNLTKKAHRPHM